MKKWAYSFNGEEYTGSFDSKAEAIKEARAEWGDRDTAISPMPEKLYAGIEVEPPITWCDMGENYVESMQEQLDEYGEWAELFDGQVTNEDIEELDKSLNAAVEKWIKDRNIKPGFFIVDAVEEINIADWYKED